MGVEAYNYGQMQKLEILKLLLEGYNDGRRKGLFCLVVNLLELEDLKTVVGRLEEEKHMNKAIKQNTEWEPWDKVATFST